MKKTYQITESGKKELEGAKLEVRDEFNQVVDSWTSTKDPHFVNGLEEGKTYTLIETTAPDGYIKAESITFTLAHKENMNVTMKDAQMKISKVDEETGRQRRGSSYDTAFCQRT